MPEKIAFFDVDHTLIKKASGEYFICEAFRQGVFPLSLLAAIPGLYFKYRFSEVHWDTWERTIPGIAGIPSDTLTGIAEGLFARRYLPALFPEMRERIAALHDSGVPVWLATSSIDFMVKPIAEYLSVDGMLASELEFENGVSTGRFFGKPVFGKEKLSRVRSQAGSLGVDLSECSFYSDSIHDLPLLEAAGTPVAVNPDLRLAKVAKKRGWQVVRC